jgi:NAD+ synthase
VRIALVQLNPTLGDLAGNAQRIEQSYTEAKRAGAHLVVTPELSLTGYFPEDLVLKPAFQKAVMDCLSRLAMLTQEGPPLLVGAPELSDKRALPYNSAFLLQHGKISVAHRKRHLPHYGVFDDARVFAAGMGPHIPMTIADQSIGLMICEDAWHNDVASDLKKAGADFLVVMNASPYERGKVAIRQNILAARVKETGVAILAVNQVGGQDEIVYDGTSFVLDQQGVLCGMAASCKEDMLLVDLEGGAVSAPRQELPNDVAQDYNAIVLGIKDYAHKNGFTTALLGLSGGIDSALVAVMAADALGADKVHAVMMPSPYTSEESFVDAKALADNIGCSYDIISIADAMEVFDGMLAAKFAGKQSDITEENIQSRLRGTTLMALSNKFGHLLLATGNKSEMATGYATLYGDMAGGYAPLKDLYKTKVYELAKWRNEKGNPIPINSLQKAPTAELRPGQKDQDTLPAYDVLDSILEKLIEKDMAPEAIAAEGYDRKLAERVAAMLYRAEYKRRQSPPGPKVTAKAFGRERRYPITNHYR